jgi:multidrug efflux pump subunit AcrA (membrane-fusion protein)
MGQAGKMTLFRPEVIDAQRRRVFGAVTLHQPTRLIAFTAVAVIGVALGTAFLSLGQFARKETVAGWVAPGGGLSEVRIAQPGMIAALAVAQGDTVRRGQTLAIIDTSAAGGSVWNRQMAVSSSLVVASTDGQVVAVNGRVGEAANPNAPLVSIAPKDSPLEAQILLPTRAAGFVSTGQNVRLMVDAFPFQQYGVIQGEIREISRTALKPGEMTAPIEFKEAVYRVNVTLSADAITAYGISRPLQSGMTLKADVITDKRTFMSWLLDPLLAARARAKAG